jgi:hypothetical protein
MSYAAEIFIRFGLETGVAYINGEFRGKDDWLKGPVEIGISSRFISNIMCRRRVPELIRQMCHLCLYRAQLNGLQFCDLIWIVPVLSTVAALFGLPGSQRPSTVGAGRPFVQQPTDPALQFLTVCLRLAGAFAKFQTAPLHRRHTDIRIRSITSNNLPEFTFFIDVGYRSPSINKGLLALPGIYRDWKAKPFSRG